MCFDGRVYNVARFRQTINLHLKSLPNKVLIRSNVIPISPVFVEDLFVVGCYLKMLIRIIFVQIFNAAHGTCAMSRHEVSSCFPVQTE